MKNKTSKKWMSKWIPSKKDQEILITLNEQLLKTIKGIKGLKVKDTQLIDKCFSEKGDIYTFRILIKK